MNETLMSIWKEKIKLAISKLTYQFVFEYNDELFYTAYNKGKRSSPKIIKQL